MMLSLNVTPWHIHTKISYINDWERWTGLCDYTPHWNNNKIVKHWHLCSSTEGIHMWLYTWWSSVFKQEHECKFENVFVADVHTYFGIYTYIITVHDTEACDTGIGACWKHNKQIKYHAMKLSWYWSCAYNV